MRIVTILGTRPQIIKTAPVLKAFERVGVNCQIVNTGQHYDYEMNKEFFDELQLPRPTVDLNIGPATPNEQLSRIITGLEESIATDKPDLALIPGDTNSALAAGIACSKLGVPIAHLESGCRMWDYRLSEEINRRVLDHISQVLSCPTRTCLSNLRSEHVMAESVAFLGDTMLDSVLQSRVRIEKSDVTSRLGAERGSFVFMTLHRAENVDDGHVMLSIMKGIGLLPIPVLFSVHPRTLKRIGQYSIEMPPNVTALDPCSYVDTLRLVRDSCAVFTDSGGLEKEAYFLGVPSLVAREGTPWPEIAEAGASIIVGHDERRIARSYSMLPKAGSKRFGGVKRIFGDGHAATKVVRQITKFLASK